jgi:hypothetical protein
MSTATLKTIVTILLVATGAFHLLVAGLGAPAAWRTPLAVFGVFYALLGIWTWRGGRTSVLVALLMTGLGLGLGGVKYLQSGGPATLPIMFGVDVAIVIAGALWAIRTRSGAA